MQQPQTFDQIQERWISGHLYYHQSLNPVVQGFVHPLVVSLLREDQIDAFFFVRAGLGGPHLRLRLRLVPEARNSVLEAMQESAQIFLDRYPSTQSLDEMSIRRANAHILASDPHEIDDSVYPDNSFTIIPFRPEVERYGGLGHLQESLDFFTLSSITAIEFLSKDQDLSPSNQLGRAFRLLLQQALGFAADEFELCDLLRYGVDSWGEMLPKVVEKGDQIATSRMHFFLSVFHQSLVEVSSLPTERECFGGPREFLVLGANRLSDAIGTADRHTRARIGGSQLHMTSTRLGLSNAEEVYLSSLLTTTLLAVRSANGGNLSWLGEKLAKKPSKGPGRALGDLLPPALALFVGMPITHALVMSS